jgi:hypothetical protein
VKNLFGKISYSDHGPVDDVVVEIYEPTDAYPDFKNGQIIRANSRRAACVTASDGAFCFPDLPSGRYFLRAGTRSSQGGMNYTQMRVNLDRRWWTGWFRRAKPIKLELRPGT